MIYRGDREIESAMFGSRPLGAIYRGVRLLWEAIRSCFGAGFWENGKPWVDTEGWKD